MNKTRSAIGVAVVVALGLVGLEGFASVRDCRDALMGIRSELERVSPKTIGALEALRFVAIPAPQLKVQLQANLAKDPYLKSKLTEQEIGALATQLLSGELSHRTVSHVIGRFIYQKDHADEIAQARAKRNAEPKVSGNTAAVLAKAKTYLDKEWSHFDEATRQQILSFLENSVLSDPEFQNNPRVFLQTWQTKRGGLEMLIIPEDPAQSFLEYLDRHDQLVSYAQQVKDSGLQSKTPSEVLSAKWSAAEQTEISKTVNDYVNKDWSHFDVGQREGIADYIINSILADPEFQKNPAQYLRTWQSKRGGLEMLMVPQDPAQKFLETLARAGQLENFARMVKASGLKPRDPKAVLSAEWTKAGREKVVKVAVDYVEKDWSHFEPTLRQSIVTYLETTVFTDATFKADPVQYLTKALQNRGGFDMLAVPQDPALGLLKSLYRSGQLVPFAASVRDAGD